MSFSHVRFTAAMMLLSDFNFPIEQVYYIAACTNHIGIWQHLNCCIITLGDAFIIISNSAASTWRNFSTTSHSAFFIVSYGSTYPRLLGDTLWKVEKPDEKHFSLLCFSFISFNDPPSPHLSQSIATLASHTRFNMQWKFCWVKYLNLVPDFFVCEFFFSLEQRMSKLFARYL